MYRLDNLQDMMLNLFFATYDTSFFLDHQPKRMLKRLKAEGQTKKKFMRALVLDKELSNGQTSNHCKFWLLALNLPAQVSITSPPHPQTHTARGRRIVEHREILHSTWHKSETLKLVALN